MFVCIYSCISVYASLPFLLFFFNFVQKFKQKIFFLCFIKGKPKPLVQWFCQEEEIDLIQTDLYEIIENEKLNSFVIKAAILKNTGQYYAKISNEVGSDVSNRAKLLVKRNFKLNVIFLSNFLQKEWPRQYYYVIGIIGTIALIYSLKYYKCSSLYSFLINNEKNLFEKLIVSYLF